MVNSKQNNNQGRFNKKSRYTQAKPKACPDCREGVMKKRTRRNYPFGKKSKAEKTTREVCNKCGYSKLII